MPHHRSITTEWSTPNRYRTYELDASLLQRDADWCSTHYESLNVIPKFTKGQPSHPCHPKRYIHDSIDRVIAEKLQSPGRLHTIKVCMDCIDDTDFITHLMHASRCGVWVQCVVDWRKMTLTNSDNYARLKRSGIELLGVFCSSHDSRAEVSPDMHLKYVIFGDSDCILGSFNITFDRWGANWESGLTFHSEGVCRLLDNIFQSLRGGVIQRYGIDPLSRFNLLYTFGCHYVMSRKFYRPQHAIVSEIHRARRSIRLCLFLIHEMQSEYQDSVIDALLHAKNRRVDIRIILNGHIAHIGDPAAGCSMDDELRKPLLPSVQRLRDAGIAVSLVYGVHDQPVPYCPLHSKYAIIDDEVVLEGSLNWYNTSLFSHDLLVVASDRRLAEAYNHEFHQILRLFRTY
jgi:phosphatidylserine/phosphatidylglycerophosphate/cardiolipin synthase-like enzyme